MDGAATGVEGWAEKVEADTCGEAVGVELAEGELGPELVLEVEDANVEA